MLRVGGTKCEMRLDKDGFMPLNATDGVPEGGAAHVLCHMPFRVKGYRGRPCCAGAAPSARCAWTRRASCR